MLSDSLKLKGHYRIEVREHGKLIKVVELDNVLTELYRTAIINNLMSGVGGLEMKYFAVGTDDTTATANDTQLGAEIFRSTPTSQQRVGNTLVTIWVLTPEQANAHLKEIGVFIGSANASLNSGTLMSRINIDILKTRAVEVTFKRTDFVII